MNKSDMDDEWDDCLICKGNGHQAANCPYPHDICKCCGRVSFEPGFKCPCSPPQKDMSLFCPNCRFRGHLINNCPNDRYLPQCTRCNAVDHFEYNCEEEFPPPKRCMQCGSLKHNTRMCRNLMH